MNKITSIQQLVNHLSQCDRASLNNVYQLLSIPKEAFDPYLFWSKKRYTRNCIVRTDNYELLILCWEKGQSAAIHSHDNQECWVYNVDGKFGEDRYELDSANNPIKIKEGGLNENAHSYMVDSLGFHDLKNANNGRSISLHLYAKPLKYCSVYNTQDNCFDLKELNYDSFEGKTTVHYQI